VTNPLTRASFTQRGPSESPFAGGEYHGVLLFPAEYPFKPPGIKVEAVYSTPAYFSDDRADVHSIWALSTRQEDLLLYVRFFIQDQYVYLLITSTVR